MKLVYLTPTNEVIGSSCFQLWSVCHFVHWGITLVIITHDALELTVQSSFTHQL